MCEVKEEISIIVPEISNQQCVLYQYSGPSDNTVESSRSFDEGYLFQLLTGYSKEDGKIALKASISHSVPLMSGVELAVQRLDLQTSRGQVASEGQV